MAQCVVVLSRLVIVVAFVGTALSGCQAPRLEEDEKPDQDSAAQAPGPGRCAVCGLCGGRFPLENGRLPYWRDRNSKWEGYGRKCDGEMEVRTPDKIAQFSSYLCCERVGAEDWTQAPTGACVLCDECQTENYSFYAGNTSWHSGEHPRDFANYVAHYGQCDRFMGTKYTRGSAMCCKQAAKGASYSACALCTGTCGGVYLNNGGRPSHPEVNDSVLEPVDFVGYGPDCSGSLTQRHAKAIPDLPRLCCSR